VAKTSKFDLVKPTTSTTRGVRLRFDCNDFPIDEEGSVATLVLPFQSNLVAAWKSEPRIVLKPQGDNLEVRFKGCKVDLPLDALQPGQKLPASMRLLLGPGPAGTFRVDLWEEAGERVLGGMSFTAKR
jgi:hypothetical protein